MKRLILLLFLLSFASASDNFGYSRVSVERVWTIEGPVGSSIDFTGSLVVNNSNQHIISITTDPGIDYETNKDGVVTIHYQGELNSTKMVLKATALVNVDYDTNILSDAPLPENNLSFTNLTEPNEEIETEARLLAEKDSTLNTIANMANWVNDYLEYDLACWGEVNPAQVVFEEQRGVCVEFSHLFISMARSAGLETRYVSGYVLAPSWQPHAWVEVNVPGYGWLPVDPTFNQAGILDSSHVAMNYGDDQSTSYDILLTDNTAVTMTAQNTVTEAFSNEDPKGILLSIDFDNETYIVDVSITNERPEYVFGTYVVSLPEGYGTDSSSIMLLSPDENTHRYYGFNRSLFDDGYTYSVPIYASFNDARDDTTITISTNDAPKPAADVPKPCAVSLFLLCILCARVLH